MFKEDGTEVRTFPNGYDVRVVRKQDILDCIDDNIIDKDIALELGISEKTVRNHISNVMQKLGVKGRAGAVVELLKMNELSLDE